MQRKMFTMVMATVLAATGIVFVACRPRGQTATTMKSGPSPDVQAGTCTPGDGWAGRMGMVLEDVEGGARVRCVVHGIGLHHIGIFAGDVITALNRGVRVTSAEGFEAAAGKLAGDRKHRIRKWEFTLERSGTRKTVKPSRLYPGCGLYSFEDCGPLDQYANIK